MSGLVDTLDGSLQGQLISLNQRSLAFVLEKQVLENIFTRELIEAAFSDRQHNVRIEVNIGHLNVQNGFGVWNFENACELLHNFKGLFALS